MPNELEDLHIDEISIVGAGANKGARAILLKQQTLGRMGGPGEGGPSGRCVCPECGHVATHETGDPCYDVPCPECGAMMTRVVSKQRPTKAEGDGKHYPASDYAYVPDREKSSTWKLRLTSTPGGGPDAGIVGAAVAALGKGFRGQKVKIPAADLPAVVGRVKAAWLKANPEKDRDDLPNVLKKGCAPDEEGSTMPHMNPDDKSEKVSLWKQFGVALGIVDKDDLIPGEEVVVDKDAKVLTKELGELQESFKVLEKKYETAESVNVAVEEISKAKSPAEVDAVLEKIEDEGVLKAVTDRAGDRKIELEKSADDDVVKAFRAELPESLHEGFDKLEDDERAKFMKSYSEPGEDPTAKALETMAQENKVLAAKVDKMEESDSVAAIEKDLKDLDGLIKSVPETAKTIAKLRKSDPDAADEMLEEYKALGKQAQEEGLFDVIGQEKGAGGDALEKIEKAVAKYREDHPDVTPEAAEAEVLKEHPELYTEYVEDKEG